jgi:hypothetical protein
VALARLERFAPLAGVVAVVLWLLGIVVVESGNTPADDAPIAEIARYFETEENSLYLGAVLFFLGILFFVWFAASLRAAVVRAERGVGRVASVVYGSAVMASVCGMGLLVPQISGAFAANESNRPLSPGAAQALWEAGSGFFIAAAYSNALLLLATSVAIWRWRVLPVWLAWIQTLLAIVLLIPPIGWAGQIFVFPLWVALVGVLLFLREEGPMPSAATQPTGVMPH